MYNCTYMLVKIYNLDRFDLIDQIRFDLVDYIFSLIQVQQGGRSMMLFFGAYFNGMMLYFHSMIDPGDV